MARSTSPCLDDRGAAPGEPIHRYPAGLELGTDRAIDQDDFAPGDPLIQPIRAGSWSFHRILASDHLRRRRQLLLIERVQHAIDRAMGAGRGAVSGQELLGELDVPEPLQGLRLQGLDEQDPIGNLVGPVAERLLAGLGPGSPRGRPKADGRRRWPGASPAPATAHGRASPARRRPGRRPATAGSSEASRRDHGRSWHRPRQRVRFEFRKAPSIRLVQGDRSFSRSR